MIDFQGKVAVITGAASGIGLATARLYAQLGGTVLLADIQAERGAAAAAELAGAAFRCTDVAQEDQVAALVAEALARWGRLDCMINNAGLVGAIGPITEIAAEDWRQTLGVLVDGAFFGTKHAARHMAAEGHGCILNVTSIAGVSGGYGPHPYTAAKHAIVGLTRSAASELAPRGVRVNAVGPGRTATPLVAAMLGGHEQAVAGAAQASPMRQPIHAEDVANALIYLASDLARNVTGHVLMVDGGKTAFATDGRGATFHAAAPVYLAGAD